MKVMIVGRTYGHAGQIAEDLDLNHGIFRQDFTEQRWLHDDGSQIILKSLREPLGGRGHTGVDTLLIDRHATLGDTEAFLPATLDGNPGRAYWIDEIA